MISALWTDQLSVYGSARFIIIGVEFTEIIQRTFRTARLASVTDIPAEFYGPVAEVGRYVGRDQLDEVFFHLCRLFVLGKTEPSCDTDTVGICYHSRLAENVAEHKIGSFSADA